ncbi:MAG: DUF882 domain-containing protein [Polyangiales bacterium]
MRTIIIATGLLLAGVSGVAAESAPAGSEPGEPRAETKAEAKTETPAEPVAEEPAASDAAVSEADDPADAVEPRAADAPCLAEPVAFRRRGRTPDASLSLTLCAGGPNHDALETLSELAQPLPAAGTAPEHAEDEGPVHELDAGLLTRLQSIAAHFPGRAIEIVSGYRPNARPGSRHRSGRALDLRIEGVDNRELSELARTFEATGVGYYPNSTFVHVDVRDTQFYWVDRSAPGERPRYGEEPAAKPAQEEARAASAPAEGDGAENATDALVQSRAALEAELRNLSDRALVVMNAALGRTLPYDRKLPGRSEY